MSNTRIKLKVDDPHEVIKISHHRNLFILRFEEIMFKVKIRDRISKKEYVINPARERGIGVCLK